MPDVIQDLRLRLADPWALAEALGLLEGAQRQGGGLHVRCPAHVERTASCSITRGPDGTARIKCFACDFTADALGLVAKVRGLDLDRQFRAVLEEAAAIAGISLGGGAPAPRVVLPARPAPPPPVRPPRDELRALWRAAAPIDDPARLSVPDVARFCWRRGWYPPALARLKLARVLPLEHAWPTWWPASWAPAWRLAILAYEPDGSPASLHARAVTDATPKTRWPLHAAAGGLLFADARGRAILSGSPPPELAGVLLCEGLTDFLAAALAMAEAHEPYAVLGATAGGFSALARVRWPSGLPAIIATDHDPAGERYANEIRVALRGADLRRWQPPKVA